MRLPKYAMLMDNDLPGIKVIQLERPYIIASVFDFNREDHERIGEMHEIKINEQEPIAKVKGYSIWLKQYATLENQAGFEYTQNILEEMADYFLNTRIANKPGLYRRSEESGRDERRYDPERQRKLRERRQRIKKED